MDSGLTYAPRYTVADAFCGCGGLSLGFSMVGRFDVVLGIDIRPEALETFRFNHSLLSGLDPTVIQEDIRETDGEAFLRSMERFRVREPGDLDCLIGGPPCEGFSQNRTDKMTGNRTNKFIEDPRNYLFRWFVDLAGSLQPKVVLIENVPDLVRHRDGSTLEEVLHLLDRAGYTAEARVLNAADYGVPQIRRRAFILAQRTDDLARTKARLAFPNPTHKPYPLMHYSLMHIDNWFPGDSGYWVSVREAIGDLPEPTTQDDYDHSMICYPPTTLSSFRRSVRSATGVPYNHLRRSLGPNGLAKLQALQPGSVCSDLPDELRPRSHYHYSYTRMSWHEPARTITKFVYHAGSGQFGHPEEDRVVTIREAARLQSFPDDFRFIGTEEIRKLSAMIGSAVPPRLARAIACNVTHYLDTLHSLSLSPAERAVTKVMQGDAVVRRLERSRWSSSENRPKQRELFSGGSVEGTLDIT